MSGASYSKGKEGSADPVHDTPRVRQGKQPVHSYPLYHRTHPNTVTKPLRALPQLRDDVRAQVLPPMVSLPSHASLRDTAHWNTLKGVYLSSPETMPTVMSTVWVEFNHRTINTWHLIGKLTVVDW